MSRQQIHTRSKARAVSRALNISEEMTQLQLSRNP